MIAKKLTLAFATIAIASAFPARAQDTAVSLSLTRAIAEMNASLRGEISKAITIKKASLEGIASYQMQQRVQENAADLKERFKQSDLVCNDMSSQTALATGRSKSQTEVMTAQTRVASRQTANRNTAATVQAAYQATNARFCSEAEVAQGVCRAPTDASYARFAGADQDAMYLFQTRDGGATYEGSRSGPQAQAVDSLIQRVVHGPAPVEQLQGGVDYTRTPAGRIYVELARRYAAMKSMAAYSLNQIKASKVAAN